MPLIVTFVPPVAGPLFGETFETTGFGGFGAASAGAVAATTVSEAPTVRARAAARRDRNT